MPRFYKVIYSFSVTFYSVHHISIPATAKVYLKIHKNFYDFRMFRHNLTYSQVFQLIHFYKFHVKAPMF